MIKVHFDKKRNKPSHWIGKLGRQRLETWRGIFFREKTGS